MSKKARAFLGDAASKIWGVIVLVVGFFLWGYLHQLFSFADCGENGHPDMSLGAIVASGFGMTACVEPPRKDK